MVSRQTGAASYARRQCFLVSKWCLQIWERWNITLDFFLGKFFIILAEADRRSQCPRILVNLVSNGQTKKYSMTTSIASTVL